MSLTSYTRSSGRKNGGIRTIGLIDQSELVSATYSSADQGYSEITLSEACYFAKYEFREDEAEYKESVSVNHDARVVTHELSFILDKMGNDAAQALTDLLNAHNSGIIALITTTNGDSFLVGYSPEFLKERPLRIDTVNGTTGKQLGDNTREIVTLKSQDVTKARPFLGEFSTLFE
ncbi:MAG: hypothetical protein PHV49_06900 [Alistipes sp.]|nr:hypothetical protein [Alistipes sp.]